MKTWIPAMGRMVRSEFLIPESPPSSDEDSPTHALLVREEKAIGSIEMRPRRLEFGAHSPWSKGEQASSSRTSGNGHIALEQNGMGKQPIKGPARE